jgi:hypothetical protein
MTREVGSGSTIFGTWYLGIRPISVSAAAARVGAPGAPVCHAPSASRTVPTASSEQDQLHALQDNVWPAHRQAEFQHALKLLQSQGL